MMGNRRVGVLLGGLSAERELSVRSGEAIIEALAERGYDVCPIFVDREADLALRHCRIDVAFLALLGRYGEDGCVQGMLEIMGVPYTGSGVLASALAMNKAKAKEVFRWHNLPTPAGYVIRTAGMAGEDQDNDPGSASEPRCATTGRSASRSSSSRSAKDRSLGVAIAEDELELEAALEDALRYDDEVLVERFAHGKLVTVAVIDGKPWARSRWRRRAVALPFAEGRRWRARARTCPRAFRPSATARRCAWRPKRTKPWGVSGAASVDLVLSERGNEAAAGGRHPARAGAHVVVCAHRRGRGGRVRGSGRGDPPGRTPERSWLAAASAAPCRSAFLARSGAPGRSRHSTDAARGARGRHGVRTS